MGRSKPDDVKVIVKLGSDPTEHMLSAKRSK